MLEIGIGAWLVLFLGDFFSTFCYHVPEHVFGSLHLKTHHSAKQTFRHYAILTATSHVLLDGILGALPYLAIAVPLWFYSPAGTILGLLLGQFHVWWRHVCVMDWQTPKLVAWVCHVFGITTPEQHWLHHQKTTILVAALAFVKGSISIDWTKSCSETLAKCASTIEDGGE
jgi:hypothetical protein